SSGLKKEWARRSGPKATIRLRSAREQRDRIDWGRSLAQFEVQLRPRHRSGHARETDDVTASDIGALLHADRFEVGIGRDVPVGMADQDKIAIALDARAHIDDLAVLSRTDRRALWRFDIDAGLLARDEIGDDLARDRPAELVRARHDGLG